MEAQDLHDLTAAYALDALDPAEEREFEQHLAACARCREELAELREAAGALAFATTAPPPPPHLRQRILDEARGEIRNVVPLRRRRPFQATVALAGLAAAASVALAFWAVSLSNELDRERAALAVLADPAARTIALEGAAGRLVVDDEGQAALVVRDLAAAPRGKTYEAWVIEGERPLPAGLFEGDEAKDLVLLERPVPAGAIVAVTIEDEGGVDSPSGDPLFTAQA